MTDMVLVVDDEVNVLKTLRRALRAEPYQLLTAQTGEEALALLQENCCKVVVSDEKMPGMSGTAFLTLVKERWPDSVRIMLTGHATLNAAMNAVNEGEIYRFFSKPWDDLALKFAIRSGLERYDLEARRRALLRAIPDTILRIRADGVILDFHGSETGPLLPDAQVVGRTLQKVIPTELVATTLAQMERTLRSGTMELVEFPFELQGEPRQYEARMVPAGPDEVLSVVRDVTDRMQALEKVRLQQERLEELNRTLEARVTEEVGKNREKDRVLAHQARLAAMGEMVGAIAHQWRQPLTVTGSLVQNLGVLAAMGRLSPGFVEKTVAAAMGQIRFMSETIDDLRNFFRPGKEMERFDLGEVVEQAVRIVHAQIEKQGIEVCREAEGEEPLPARGYPNELTQVLVNLLNNACHAIEERVPVPGEELPPGKIELRVGRGGGRYRLCIRDNGCGVPPELRERIFEPYFTTRTERGGTGTGLYMSKMIIESSMGGRLYLEPAAAGACMVIEISGESA
ncbi:MAG TPA: ATP-binding protein [Geomonas sp.]|nr:ATP-binding protein [Geomonas sp.]